jgi:hypothetical protein
VEDADMTKKKRTLELSPAMQAQLTDALHQMVRDADRVQAEVDAMTPEEFDALKADASKWRRTRPVHRSEYPDELLLASARKARESIVKRYGREPESIPGGRWKLYEMVADRCRLAPTTVRDRLLKLQREKAAVRR